MKHRQLASDFNSPAVLDELLRSPSGIALLIERSVAENDHLELKSVVNRRDPKWDEELRADCAALASSECGFMVVGIEESTDGKNSATKIASVEAHADLKNAIEDRLGSELSPPLRNREVWTLRRLQPVQVDAEGLARIQNCAAALGQANVAASA